MILAEYSWLVSVGFFTTLGILFALVLSIVTFKLVSTVVDLFWKPLPKVIPPPQVKNLTVKATGKTVTAMCTCNGQAYVHSVLVASHGSVRNAAAAAQTELIKIVLEDYHGIKSNKSE